jgi:hypothetical protein
MTKLFFRLTLSVLLILGTNANAQEANNAKEAGGPHEGIKVHGHWTIEVRNPDGKLVTHREFENSLVTSGALAGPLTLSTVLGRASTIGLWIVYLYFASAPDGPCLLGPNTPSPCIAVESADLITGSAYFHTLTLNAPFNQADPNFGKLTLNGSITVQNAGQISHVETFVGGCAPTVAPASCVQEAGNQAYNQLGENGFTLATPAPIPVTVGQNVQVTVVFSFS